MTASIAALLFLLWILLQTSPVQTLVTRQFTNALEKNLDAEVVFSKIHFRPFNALTLKGLAIIDSNPSPLATGAAADTVVKVESTIATFSLKGLLKGEGLGIRRATVADASVALVAEGDSSNFARIFGGLKGGGGMPPLRADRLILEDVRFRRIGSPEAPESPAGCISFNDLDILLKALHVRNAALKDGEFEAVVRNLEAVEKSGYSLKLSVGSLRGGKGQAEITGFSAEDGSSLINLPLVSLKDSVLTAEMSGSRIDCGTAGWFLPGFKGKKAALLVDLADIKGNLSELEIGELSLSERESGIKVSLNGTVKGLDNPRSARFDITARNVEATTEGAARLLESFAPSMKTDIRKFAEGQTVKFKGKGSGALDAMRIRGDLSVGQGKASADLAVNGLMSGHLNFKGRLNTERLDVGMLTGVDKLGECTLRGSLNAAKKGKGMTLEVDSVYVYKMTALGYEYSEIRGAGIFSDNAFDGRIICSDPNLNFLFQGLFTLSDKTQNGLYKFYANIGYADLHALHFDEREISRLSGQIDANYMTVSKKDIIGDMNVKNLMLEDEFSRHDIGDITVKSHSNDRIHRINIESSFLTGSFIGTRPLTSLPGAIQNLSTRRDLSALYASGPVEMDGNDYNLELSVHDATDVLSFIKPGLFIADSTRLGLSVTKEGDVRVSLKSPRLAIGRNYLKNFRLNMDNSDGSLNGAASCTEISASLLKLMNNTFTIFADDNRFSFGYSYDNRSKLDNRGSLSITGLLSGEGGKDIKVSGQVLPSSIRYNGERWDITSSRFLTDKDGISLDTLAARCENQSIMVAGGVSFNGRDTLSLNMVNLDLGILNGNSSKDLGISGMATGSVVLQSPVRHSPGLTMDLTTVGSSFGHCPLGTLRLSSEMDRSGTMYITARNDLEGSRNLDMSARYDALGKDLLVNATLDHLNTGYLTPVLGRVFSQLGGSVSGNLILSRKDGNLQLFSNDCRFNDVLLKVAYTNVPYYFDGDISIDDKGLSFDNVTVRDRYAGKGRVSGGLTWGNLKNIRMDTRIALEKAEAFDLGENDNPYFYGNVTATGSLDIKGPTNALQMGINVRTDGNGNIHIPLDNRSGVKKNELLTFKEREKEAVRIDPYEAMVSKMRKSRKKSSDLQLKISVNADQGTEAFVEIDRSAGDVLVGRGAGLLEMDIRPSRNLFAINGDYRISEGLFKFNAMDIAKRVFTISDGSTVRFNGDIMDSDLNISGLYTTKASVASLIADTTSVSSRRTVNCGIGISGKLREPQLSFSVDIPDLDPTTRSKVESALNTDDKVQKQMVSLLLSGSFMPDEQSGIVNNSAMIYSNLAEIMAGQFNSILQKLDIPLDFGLNYQPTETGTNIFDVAVSTQLFNNRVLVNGAFGNREYRNSTGEDMAGDLDIEVKLDKKGLFRFNLFSHSADDYTNYLDNTQRNGVGVTFQREFDSFIEFFRELFCRRKDEVLKKEKKTIRIMKEDTK
ncbi:MAG: translocation/assembly module TamB domain-containing protein [Candidatus Cryptobacteroides sp.]